MLSQILDLPALSTVLEIIMRGKGGSGAPPLDGSNHAVSSSWMQGWLPDASDDERETMIQGIYGLCCAQNETRDGKRMPEPRVVAERVFGHIQEWLGCPQNQNILNNGSHLSWDGSRSTLMELCRRRKTMGEVA